MRINTKLKSLELTKQERAILDKASYLTSVINKHADGPLQELARTANGGLLGLTSWLADEAAHADVSKNTAKSTAPAT